MEKGDPPRGKTQKLQRMTDKRVLTGKQNLRLIKQFDLRSSKCSPTKISELLWTMTAVCFCFPLCKQGF